MLPIRLRPLAFALGALLSCAAIAQSCPANGWARSWQYPPARKIVQLDKYHGVEVADPYRWLEDPDSADTAAWARQQNALTSEFLARIPEREAIRRRLAQLWQADRPVPRTRAGNFYLYSHNDGTKNQPILYAADDAQSPGRVLVDPNLLAADGSVALAGMAISYGGALLAYGVSHSGSDWSEWRVRDIATATDTGDHLVGLKSSTVTWLPGNSGVTYVFRSDAKHPGVAGLQSGGLYFHKLGTPQSADTLLYRWSAGSLPGRVRSYVSNDGRTLLIGVVNISTSLPDLANQMYYKDLTRAASPVLPLIEGTGARYYWIANAGPLFYFRTDRDAVRGKVVAIDIREPQPANWKTIVAETADRLQDAKLVGRHLVLHYLKDARSEVKVTDLAGEAEYTLALPGIGSVSGLRAAGADAFDFTFSSFTVPQATFRFDIGAGKATLLRRTDLGIDPDAFETRQVFYTSRDGTRVPMFIVAKKGIKLDGANPTYLYGYGGFDRAMLPTFSAANLVWLEMGGVYAVANLRGGGEYGEAWHEAGTKLKKQNVFDDFIGAAEYLIASKVTSPAKLAIGGRSNGGLLVGAAITQRPELFGAALPGVGVMDMLRFAKLGGGWTAEYGSPNDADEFKALYAYSPLHNLKKGICLPPTMITTAENDDRVVPAHSFKFAATAQEMQAAAAPVLIRIETKAGHGAGKAMSSQINAAADEWSFLVRALGMRQ